MNRGQLGHVVQGWFLRANWQRESCAVTEVLRRAFPIADLGRILGLIGSLQPVRELIWVRIGIFQLFQDRQVAVGRRPRLFRVRGDDDAQPLRGPAERQVHLPVRYGGVPCWIMPIYHERRPPVAASGALYRHNVQSIPHGGRRRPQIRMKQGNESGDIVADLARVVILNVVGYVQEIREITAGVILRIHPAQGDGPFHQVINTAGSVGFEPAKLPLRGNQNLDGLADGVIGSEVPGEFLGGPG